MATHTRAMLAYCQRLGVTWEPRTIAPPTDGPSAQALTQRLLTGWSLHGRPFGVHLDCNGLGARAVWRACQLAQVPCSATFHGGHRYLDPPSGAVLRVELEWLRETTQVFALNAGDLALLRAAGIERSCEMPHGVDTAIFHPRHRSHARRLAWGATDAEPVVLWCGQLLPQKEPLLFATIANAVQRAVPRAQVVVVGDGPLRSALEQHLTHGHFLGALVGHELTEVMASADLLIFPSLVETWGLVVGEAMASGLAVVARDHAGAHCLIRSGIDGWTTRLDQPDDLISAAIALAEDLPRARQLGQAAVERIVHWDWQRVAADWITHWRAHGVVA